ncbi:response regulator transcription factor [uncultured Sphingomonas sp.]|uniref:response regulator transcription factor n=1 Tax=uncultured Sphingomonas sp. TaxID=158754 RepID=UPI0025F1CC7F|nr:response regulator transcription factor [uncultured Sphingomonas sp.]
MSDDRRLLIVEDDATFARTLQRSFERRGYSVAVAHSPAELDTLLETEQPGFAVVDLKLGTASGLPCVERLHAHDADMQIVVLTGFASITTAVEAIKLGACHYVAKPASTDEIESAFGKFEGNAAAPIGERASTIKTLEWERINQVLAETGFNISETARRLGMHRRTLARKLDKRPVR